MNGLAAARLGAFRSLAALMLVLLACVADPVRAQDGNSATGSAVTPAGTQVTWAPPWGLDRDRANERVGEVFVLPLVNDGRHLVIFQGTIPDAANAVGLAQGLVGGDPDARVTVDGAAGDPVSYWLDLVPVDGTIHGSFALARETGDLVTLTVFLAPVDTFAAGFESAQESITLDDVPVFDGVGADGLQALLDEAAPAGAAATPVDDEDVPPATGEADVPAEEPSDDAAGDQDANATEESSMGGFKREYEDENVPFADVGMVGAQQYQSPQYGIEIEWTSDWYLDEDYDEAVLSDPGAGEDAIHLAWDDDWTTWLGIYMMPADGLVISRLVDFVSTEGSEEVFGEGSQILLADATGSMGAVVALIDDTSPVLVFTEFRYANGHEVVVYVEFMSLFPESTVAALESASASITVNGEPILVYFPPEDVGEAHEDGLAATNEMLPPGSRSRRDQRLPFTGMS